MGREKIQDTIRVTGMTCTGCARTLENEFRRFADVDYSVNFPDGSIVVTYDPTAYKREDFEQAIESHGYGIAGE